MATATFTFKKKQELLPSELESYTSLKLFGHSALMVACLSGVAGLAIALVQGVSTVIV